MILLCPRYNLLQKLISVILISFRSSFLDPHFHIFLSLRLANEKKTSIIISLWYLKEKTRYNSITPTITIYYYSQSSFVEEYLLKIVKKLQEEENQKVINKIHHSIWKQKRTNLKTALLVLKTESETLACFPPLKQMRNKVSNIKIIKCLIMDVFLIYELIAKDELFCRFTKEMITL